MSTEITSSTLVFDAALVGVGVEGLVVIADTLPSGLELTAVASQTGTFAPNPLLDISWNCAGMGPDGKLGQGILSFDTTLSGELIDLYVSATPVGFSPGIAASLVEGRVLSGVGLASDFQIKSNQLTIAVGVSQANWVKWSKIGSADFTIDHSNQAGERPMDWQGQIYAIHKLGSGVVIYGQNGVSVMQPGQTTWSYKTLSHIGLINKGAVAATDFNHWFLSADKTLWEIGSDYKLRRLGYKNLLYLMSSPIVLSHDELNNQLSICDGTTGYLYSLTDKAMTEGFAGITGTQILSGSPTMVGSAAYSKANLALTTGIFDLGTRKEKTLHIIEVGIDTEASLEALIKYRLAYDESFASTPWQPITQRGQCHLPCYGIEFQIVIRSNAAITTRLDWLKVFGIVHDYNTIDVG